MAGQSRRYGMEPAHIPVLLPQIYSSKPGINRPATSFLARIASSRTMHVYLRCDWPYITTPRFSGVASAVLAPLQAGRQASGAAGVDGKRDGGAKRDEYKQANPALLL